MKALSKKLIVGAFIGAILNPCLKANAQSGVAGGGDVVICTAPDGTKKMQMYDFWNASQKYRFTVNEDNSTPYYEQVKRNLTRLANLDPVLSKDLLKEAVVFSPEQIDSYIGEVTFVPKLFNDGDGVHTVIPLEETLDCKDATIERIAQFNASPLPFERPFLISSSLWKHAPESVKFAVVQHELLYRRAKLNTENKDSVYAQYFNALISSNEFDFISPSEYFWILAKIGWMDPKKWGKYSVLVNGFTLDAIHLRLDEKGWAGFLEDVQTVSIQGKSLKITGYTRLNLDGSLSCFELYEPGARLSTVQGNTVKLKIGETACVNKDGLLLSGKIQEHRFAEIGLGGYTLKTLGDFEFQPSGKISSVTVAFCDLKKYELNFEGQTYTIGKLSKLSAQIYEIKFSKESPQPQFVPSGSCESFALYYQPQD